MCAVLCCVHVLCMLCMSCMQHHTGELDKIQGFSNPASGQELVDRMRKAGCDVEMHVYKVSGPAE